MNKKKLISTILCVSMVMGITANVMAEEKPYEGITLNVLDVSYAPTNGLKEYLDEFEEMTGINVNLEVNAYADVNTKKEVELSAGSDAYDVMHICSATVNRLGNAGWVEELTPYIEASPEYEYEDFIEFARNTLSVNGNVYGVPVASETIIMYYRKDVLEELGLEVPTTMDELLAACETIKAERDDIAPIALRGRQGQGVNMYVLGAFLFPSGGSYYNEDMTALTLNTPETVAGVEYYANLLQNYAPAGASDFDYTAAYTAFAQGEVAFLIDSSGLVGNFNDTEASVVADCWDCAAVFPNEEINSCVPEFAHGLSINKNSKNKEAAWEYIKWYTGKTMQLRLGEEVKFCGVSRESVWDSDVYMETIGDNDWVGAFEASIANTRVDYRPLHLSEWNYIGDTIGEAVQTIVLGADAQETLDDLQDRMTEFFEQQGYLG